MPVPEPNFLSWTVDNMNLTDLYKLERYPYAWEADISFSQHIKVHGIELPHSTFCFYEDQLEGKQFYLQRIQKKLPDLPARYRATLVQVGDILPATHRKHLRKSLANLHGETFYIHDKLGVVYKVGDNYEVKELALYRVVE